MRDLDLLAEFLEFIHDEKHSSNLRLGWEREYTDAGPFWRRGDSFIGSFQADYAGIFRRAALDFLSTRPKKPTPIRIGWKLWRASTGQWCAQHEREKTIVYGEDRTELEQNMEDAEAYDAEMKLTEPR